MTSNGKKGGKGGSFGAGLLIVYNNIILFLNSLVARMNTEKNNASKSISEFIHSLFDFKARLSGNKTTESSESSTIIVHSTGIIIIYCNCLNSALIRRDIEKENL